MTRDPGDRRPLSLRAVAAGAAVQVPYLLALLALPVGTAPLSSTALLAGAGTLGGATAGHLAGDPPERGRRHGLYSGAVGGLYLAGLFVAAVYVPAVPYGATHWFATLVTARIPVAAYVAGRDPYLVAAAALLAVPWTALAGRIAGGRVPSDPAELGVIRR